MEVLGLGGTRVKIEADSDASFFGSSNINNCQLLVTNGVGEMDFRDHLDETYFPSDIAELDFGLLQDLTLPNEYNLLEDICMQDECHSNSNSNSFTSEIYLDPSSSSSPFTDSPPLSPPSITDSDGGSVSSPSPCQADVKLKSEPNNNVLLSQLGKQIITIPLPKSSRGRSASHDSPDVQALKRHIRMIRNRESACLSRKKKKDHVTNLETRVTELELENALLKQENAQLKSRLGAQKQVPMILTPKMYSNNDGNKSKSNIPKTSAVVKVALLGLCCFVFISFRSPSQYNTNGSTNPLIQNNLKNHTSKMMMDSELATNSFVNLQDVPSPNNVLPAPNFLKSRRSFGLWETNEAREQENIILNKSSNVNTKENIQNITRNVNVNMSKEFRGHFHNPRSYRNLTFTTTPVVNKCPTPFNKTEALRVQNDLKGIFGKRIGKKKVPIKPLVYTFIDLDLQNIENKGLTIYDEKMRRFSSVLDQLQQREDTFYVVSLGFENQLLLSAQAHNASSRPKMSFVMPWKNETLGGKEEVMQIDCEVTRVRSLNTRKSNRRKRN